MTKVMTPIVYGNRSHKKQKGHFTEQSQAAGSSQRNEIPIKSINGVLKRPDREGPSGFVSNGKRELW